MSKLIIMCGVPGSGKSTLAKRLVNEDAGDIYVSRDEIRFSLVKENEEYFSKEKEVFRKFMQKINSAIEADKTVWADATHLNKASRLKLLKWLYEQPTFIEVVYVKVPIETAISQNNNRKGTRAYVPEEVIRNMYEKFEEPQYNEFIWNYDRIYIAENGNIIEKESANE